MLRTKAGLLVSVLVVANACATAAPPSTTLSAASSPSAGPRDPGDALAGRFAFTIDGMKRINGAL
jgi:hypothetical protein